MSFHYGREERLAPPFDLDGKGNGRSLDEGPDDGEDLGSERIKMRDLESILHGEGINTHDDSGLRASSRDEADLESSTDGDGSSHTSKRQTCVQGTGSVACLGLGQEGNSQSSLLPETAERSQNSGVKPFVGLGLDLNVVDVSDSTEHNPFHPYRNLGQARPADPSECGSTTGPLEESEPLRRWREMKQNGFLTSSHGGIPPVPKQQEQKKPETAKREQVNRFTKITSPSGLLSGLNPGIINHVRNSKQVHSIIEAIVRSEKAEGLADGLADGGEPRRWNRDGKNRGPGGSTFHRTSCSVFQSLRARVRSVNWVWRTRDSAIGMSHLMPATVASQWLELLYQDTRGRLAALRRSRKRVRYVIQKELPYLVLAEPSSSQENNCYFQQSDATSDKYAASVDHGRRWRILFNQMDMALSEEGTHLERLLQQVKEMQMKCEKGLKSVKEDASMCAGSSHNGRLKQGDALEGDYAVRAAAASLYSACNFIMSMDNVSCF
ncbi:unnamed protein product [Spirodela intermedia]|uniref:Uncharacterized protein n=1 Tax=Spirodela intermedia TaxID=51605 RepID=A0A7I8IAM6_SPIIN|nr:unnamed protein product [Spirodela intermedia]CAA6654608.1 unnamed protein product [Spirodela intermedia]